MKKDQPVNLLDLPTGSQDELSDIQQYSSPKKRKRPQEYKGEHYYTGMTPHINIQMKETCPTCGNEFENIFGTDDGLDRAKEHSINSGYQECPECRIKCVDCGSRDRDKLKLVPGTNSYRCSHHQAVQRGW